MLDRLVWSNEMNGLLGHPLADVKSMKSRATGLEVLADTEEFELVRDFFYPKTKLVPTGKVILAYRHVLPGRWQALIFLNEHDNVTAVHVGSLDTYALELARGKAGSSVGGDLESPPETKQGFTDPRR